jgi:molybdate transport system substrate-binding protein
MPFVVTTHDEKPRLANAKRLLIFVLVILGLGLFSCQNENKDALRIASAANMRFALETIVDAFESETGTDCEIVYASSGKLCAQIESGAPYDIFLSADYHYPKYLHNLNLAEEPQLYAYGQLIMWSKTISKGDMEMFFDKDKTAKVAIADSVLAPYGQATHSYLKSSGLMEQVSDRMVIGESISQVNQFVHTGAVKLGFTSYSTIKANDQEGAGSYVIVDNNLYPPIEQCASIISSQSTHPQAQRFLDFLLSKNGQLVLSQYGYLPVETLMNKSENSSH